MTDVVNQGLTKGVHIRRKQIKSFPFFLILLGGSVHTSWSSVMTARNRVFGAAIWKSDGSSKVNNAHMKIKIACQFLIIGGAFRQSQIIVIPENVQKVKIL